MVGTWGQMGGLCGHEGVVTSRASWPWEAGAVHVGPSTMSVLGCGRVAEGATHGQSACVL